MTCSRFVHNRAHELWADLAKIPTTAAARPFSATTHLRSFVVSSPLPNSCHSFISAAWPRLAPDPLALNVAMWGESRQQLTVCYACVMIVYTTEGHALLDTRDERLTRDLDSIDLSGRDLRRADLAGFDLSDANLRFTNLQNADLYWAIMFRADCTGADLRDALLCGADLKAVDFNQSDLRGANLAQDKLGGSTQLQGASLAGAQLDGADLTGAEYDDATVFPDSFDPQIYAMRKVLG